MGSSYQVRLVSDGSVGESSGAENWSKMAASPRERRLKQDAEVDAFSQDDHAVAVLARAIQHEIIPRLMLAHRAPEECQTPSNYAPFAVTPEEVERFANLILTCSEAQALDTIESLCIKGAPIESIYLDLLAPAARYLGELWEADLCDFTDVTIGLGRLQKMLNELSGQFEKYKHPVSNGLRILLVPAPGEQHTFGLAMVAEFFQRDGWDVTGGPYELHDDPVSLVKRQKYDVVGFSLATQRQLPALTDCIRAVRRASQDAGVCIMVGGPLFAGDPGLLTHVGADLLVADGSLAPGMARIHLGCGLTAH
jgi:methanogenic corrinoid protein MtbC1